MYTHFDTNSTSLGSIVATHQLREKISFTFPPLSIARYLFIQLRELGRRGDNENTQTYIASPAFYRLSTSPKTVRICLVHLTCILSTGIRIDLEFAILFITTHMICSVGLYPECRTKQ